MKPFTEYEIWSGNRYQYTCHCPEGEAGEGWSPFGEGEGVKDLRVIAVCRGERREVLQKQPAAN